VKNKKETLSSSLTLDDELFSIPAAHIDNEQSGARRPAQPAQAKHSSAPSAKQAYLPGLSRRGRPRSKNPVPATARAKESRRKRIETGARRIELMLAADIVASLDALSAHFKESRADVLSRLIAKAAARMFK
jgi:hypothetical protein